MKNSLLIFLLFAGFQAHSQDTLAKYNIKELVIKSLGYEEFAYPNELLRRNVNDSVKSVAHVTLGELYFKENDLDKAIAHEEKALQYVSNGKYPALRFDIINYLAGHYVLKGNYPKALQYIEEIKKENNPNSDIAAIYMLMGDFKKSISLNIKKTKETAFAIEKARSDEERKMLFEKLMISNYAIASAYSYEKKIDSSYNYIQQAENFGKKINVDYFNSWWYKTTFNLILEKKYDEALQRMEKSKKIIENSKLETFQANYYKALCWQAKGEYKKSLKFAEDGLKNIYLLFSYLNYELELYNIASQSAHELGLTEKELYYSKKYYDGVKKVNYQAKVAFLAKLYDKDVIVPLNVELARKEKKSYYLWSGLAIALMLFGSYIGYSFYKSKKERASFNALIAKLEREKEAYQNKLDTETVLPELPEDILDTETLQELPESQASKITLSEETEKKILLKLESFERRQQFLSPETSLSKIARDFKTNAFYISYVIKKHKNTNLNNYINKLRIDYITHKLKFNSEYSNYKIEYLAQESGFSTYSTFKRIFTKETGMDPSKFISYLKDATQKT